MFDRIAEVRSEATDAMTRLVQRAGVTLGWCSASHLVPVYSNCQNVCIQLKFHVKSIRSELEWCIVADH